jgi:hypothetical protein
MHSESEEFCEASAKRSLTTAIKTFGDDSICAINESKSGEHLPTAIVLLA